MPSSPRALTGITTLIVLVAGWWLVTGVTHLVSPGSFPSITDTADALRQLVGPGYADARLPEHCLLSLGLIGAGFGLACGVAIPLGLVMAAMPRLEALVNPVFLLLRPIPPLAWIPLAILWLGLGDAAKLMVIFCGAFPPALINTMTGVKAIDPALIDAARMLGTPPLRLATQVLIPGALPAIFTGLRISLQASWTTLVAAELVGSLAGLGHILNAAQQDIFPSMILVAMLSVAILGWLTTSLLALLEGVVGARHAGRAERGRS